MEDVLDVAVGVLIDRHKGLLIAQRRPDVPGAGCWEFPGGKHEPGESMLDCLKRELAEEIGITDLVAAPLIRFTHNRGSRPVRVHVWCIHDWVGQPGGREGQAVHWVQREYVHQYTLLPATDVILKALDLPREYQVMPSVTEVGRDRWSQALSGMLARGVRLLRLQDDTLSDGTYADLAVGMIDRVRERNVAVMLNRSPEMVVELGADGWHCTADLIHRLDCRPIDTDHLLAVSCHAERDLAAALAIQADFAVVSPVATVDGSRIDACLGWPGFERMRGDFALPVYAGGGMVPTDVKDAIMHNAQGIERRYAALHETATGSGA